jgi:galactonate dehydratase
MSLSMKVQAANIYLVPSGNRRPVLVEIETDAGVSGIGEAGVAYGFGGPAAAAMIQQMCDRLVIGRDPFRIEQIWNDIYDQSFWAKGGGPITFSALSAIEQALWDIKGKALGVPVYELLGGQLTDRIPVYANGWWTDCWTGDDYARAGEKTVAAGYRGLKLYPLGMPDPVTAVRHPARRTLDRSAVSSIVDRLAGLRRGVGPDVDIMLDFGGGLTTDQTLNVCRRLEEFDILFVEEPADPFTLGALKKISEGTTIPIAAGERFYTRYGFHKLLETYAADIVQPDVCNTGGILEAKKIAAMAEVYNVRVAMHVYGGTLATAAAAQIAACIPNLMVQEFFPYYAQEPNYLEILENPLEASVRDGFLPIPAEPGLGVTLARARVAPYLYGVSTVG